MNLLSHYYLEHHHSSPYRQLGVLMPDLVYQFNRKLRREIFRHGIPENDDHRQIFEGIKSHYEADAFFHNSEFFRQFTGLIRSRIKELPLPSVTFRSYFLAHVFLELMLDRLLAKQYPHLCVEIYIDLESVNPAAAASYLERIGKTGVFFEFFNNFNRLLDARHLLFLADNEMFIKALLRAYQKINPVYPGREETEVLKALTDEIETCHRLELLGFFETLPGLA